MSFLLVSAYYPLKKSKHSLAEYDRWLSNFFECVTCPVVLFCSATTYASLKARARDNVQFVQREFDSFTMMSPAWMSKWETWHTIDPEKSIHSPELYAVWAAKQEFVHAASLLRQADYYLWCDAGLIREKRNASFEHTVRYTLPGKITCMRVPQPNTLSIGAGVLVGDKQAWRMFTTNYFRELDRKLNGSEQVIMGRFLNDQNAVILRPSNQYGDPWFYLADLFTKESKFCFDYVDSAAVDSQYIEHVIYINLAHRTDRQQQLRQQLSILPSTKISRLEAVLDKRVDGHVGCTRSHIAALQLAIENKWDNVLILEDDAVWSDLGQFSLLSRLASNPYDVIVLGGTYASHENYRLQKCHSAASYLIRNHYLATLLLCFQRSLSDLLRTAHPPTSALDVAWHQLQAKDNWYLVYPPLMVQGAGYSDIANKSVDYTDLTVIKDPKEDSSSIESSAFFHSAGCCVQ